MPSMLLATLVVVLIYETLIFLLSYFFKRNDIADVSWGISFILIVIVALSKTNFNNPLLLLVSFLVCAWGLRLAMRIGIRNFGKKEDFRYLKLRKESGKLFLFISFLKIYMLQGILAIIVSFPILIIASNNANLVALNYLLILIGISLWAIGFYFEIVGDFQLDKFLSESKNKGKIMQSGLWKYSRHPNYFGEILMWWALFIIALSVPNGIWAIIGPLLITFLIIKVSGIPPFERKMAKNADYISYRKRTSMLIPMPKRSVRFGI